MIRVALAATLLLAGAFTGCLGPRDGCEAPFPLVVRAYPMVSAPERYEVQTTLWNCTDAPLAIDDPCGARDGLKPSVVIENATYYLAHELNGSAAPRDAIDCYEIPIAARAEIAPGEYLEQRYAWDGTYRPHGGKAVPVPPGAYQLVARAGSHFAAARVEVPW